MSKATVPRTPTDKKVLTLDNRKQRIPLTDISITWHAGRDFHGEQLEPSTISGAQLAVVLDWLARRASSSAEVLTDKEDVSLHLDGLNEILLALGYVDCPEEIDHNAIFWTLHDILGDLSARLRAADSAMVNAGEATITLKPSASKGAA